MADVAGATNGYTAGALNGARTAGDMYSPINENQPLGRATSVTSNSQPTSNRRQPTTPARKEFPLTDTYPSKRVNGNAASQSDEDIPENMYRPDKQDLEGWIHREKLAKIESEELQAAGINLASARSRSSGRYKGPAENYRDSEGKREEKRQRLQLPAEIEDETERATWDFRLPEEIEDDTSPAAAQMYTNPLLRKSGSRIPVMTSSPMPIPAERYERDTPIARKRTASGTISLEGDLHINKIRSPTHKTSDDDDTPSAALISSMHDSPQKQRPTSAITSPTPAAKKTVSTNRKVSAPARATPSPSQRPGTRSGEQDRPRTAVQRPEGDPPWLATMYKPDPRLPPDQQLIPTLAKKQMQAQWAEEGAVPKTYDRDFTPIAVHTQEETAREPVRTRTSSSVKHGSKDESLAGPNTFDLEPVNSVRSQQGRPGTSGSINGGYSTMPKVLSPLMRESSPKIGTGQTPSIATRPSNAPPPTRMQSQSVADENDKVKKGCGCCVVM